MGGWGALPETALVFVIGTDKMTSPFFMCSECSRVLFFLRQKCSSLCLCYLQQTEAAAATTDRSGSSSSQQETDLSAQAQRGVGDGGRASLNAWRSGVNTWCSDHVNSVEQPAATELSSSNSGQETSSSAASPLPQQDVEMEMEGPKTDPAKWSVSGSFQKGRECGCVYERERERE